MTSISRFPLVIASSFTDGSTMKPKAAVGRRNRKRASNGIRLCFRTAWKKKSMRSRYRCVLSGRRFTLIPQTGRNQYDGEYEPFQPQNDPSSQIPTSFDHPLYVSFARILRIYRGVKRENSFTSHFFLSR